MPNIMQGTVAIKVDFTSQKYLLFRNATLGEMKLKFFSNNEKTGCTLGRLFETNNKIKRLSWYNM